MGGPTAVGKKWNRDKGTISNMRHTGIPKRHLWDMFLAAHKKGEGDAFLRSIGEIR